MCAKEKEGSNGIKFSEARPLITDQGPLIFPGATRFQVVDFSEAGNDILAGGCGGEVWLYRRLARGGDPLQPVFEKTYLCRIPTYIGTPSLFNWSGKTRNRFMTAGIDTFIYLMINKQTETTYSYEPLRDSRGKVISIEFHHPEYQMLDEGGYIDRRFYNDLRPVACDWNNDGGTDLLIGDKTGVIWFLDDKTNGRGFPQYECEEYEKPHHAYTGGYSWSALENYGYIYSRPKECLRYADGRVIRLGTDWEDRKTYNGCMAKPFVTDWDNDGDHDLLVAAGFQKTGGGISFLENTAAPGSPPQLVDRGFLEADGKKIPTDYHDHICVCDWFGEGRKDLLVGHDFFYIDVYRNLGGSGAPKLTYAGRLSGKNVPLAAGYTTSMIDWNKDGIPDLIEGGWWGYVEFRENVGTAKKPVFSCRTQKAQDEQGQDIHVEGETDANWDKDGGVSRPFVCDWNNDGIPDILVGTDKGLIYYLEGLPGPDPFHFRNHGPLKDRDGNVIKVHNRACPIAYDLNGDGIPDLLVAGATYQMGFPTDPKHGGDVQVFRAEGRAKDGTPILVSDGILIVDGEPLTFMVNTNTTLSCGDLDGDGTPEIFLRTNKHGSRIIKNIGTPDKPVFTMGPELELKGQGEFYLGDINGDGLPDLICGGGEIGHGAYRLNLTKKAK